MPIFATPGPIAATVEVAGAQVRVTASDRTDTVLLVKPINEASRSDVKVANKTTVDFVGGQLMNGSGNIEVGISEGTAASIDADSERGSVRNSVASQGNPATSDALVSVHARTRHGDIVIQRAAS